MGRERIITAIATVAAAVLLVPVAIAADTREIRQDLADGRLDGTYSQAELKAYLQDAVAQGYAEPTAPSSVGILGEQSPSLTGGAAGDVAGAGPLEETAQVGTLPFTGVDLALLAFGGALLLLLGLGARRLGRRHN